MAKDNNKVTIYGTITNAFKGATKFSKDEMYRVSIKLAAGQCDKLVAACADAFTDTPDAFKPKWFKEPEKTEYINFKSKFDINVIVDDKPTSLEDLLADMGNINGSEVGIAVTIKEGAVYPIAIKVYKLATTDFSDLFDTEELPF